MPTKSARGNGSSGLKKGWPRSNRGWRNTHNNIKTKKRTKLALLVLLGIIILLFLSQLIRTIHTLSSPWQTEVGKKKYTWDGKLAINLVIQNTSTPIQSGSTDSKALSLLSYIPSEKKIVITNLPPNLMVEVPSGGGKWQLSSVFQLGESNKKGEGIIFLRKTVSAFLGVGVDGVLEFTKGDSIESFRKEANIFELISNIKSDLTLWEILKLKYALSSVRFDKVKTLDLSDLSILDKEVLADGTKVLGYDPVKVDSIVSNFADPLISQEHLSIAVFNATQKPLLAQGAARLVANLGGNVIVVSNTDKKTAKSYVLGKTSQTQNRLIQIFDLAGCTNDKKCDKISPSELGIVSDRADLIVVLGDDW